MNRLNMLLVALLTTTFAVAQTDTTTVKGEQLEEIVVNANNAQRRLSTVQIGAEQIQVKELTSNPYCLARQILCVLCSCCQA